MKRRSAMQTVLRPLVDENPVTLQILGVCSALAVTTTVSTALVMAAALTAVVTISSAAISAIRGYIGHSVRLIVQITIIASLVIVVDQLLAAFAWDTSRKLSVFVGLIVSNCIVLGRAESFAMHNDVRSSALDGLGNGLGYGLVLVVIGIFRELLGAGSLLGMPVLATVENGGWFEPILFMSQPPSAFFLIGLLIWALRSWKPEQVEPRQDVTEAATAAPGE